MEIFHYYALLLRFWNLWLILIAVAFVYGLGVQSGLAWNIFTAPRAQHGAAAAVTKPSTTTTRSSATSAPSATTASAQASASPIDVALWVEPVRRKPLVAPAPLPSAPTAEDAPERRRPLRPAGGGQ